MFSIRCRQVLVMCCCCMFLLSLLLPEARATASEPSSLPSSDPSSAPSRVPSSIPSSFCPSTIPTVVPSSSQPSFVPSETPTRLPSSVPSTVPSTDFPSSSPTAEDSVRTFNCGQCERTYFDNQEEPVCQFYSRNIFLKCAINTSSCIYNTYSFSVDSLSTIAVSESCGLSVKAYKRITISKNSIITANYVNLTSSGQMIVSGTLITSGGGPVGGPGGGGGSGRGGSYGGSGGDPTCTPGRYFSNQLNQIGNVDVKHDWPLAYSYPSDAIDPEYPTMGSGGGQGVDPETGGTVHGGRGGGMINLAAPLTQLFDGHLLCEGSVSESIGYGSGSGGSICITADRLEASFQKPTIMSVRGGDGDADNGIAAGGGGRISIHARNASDFLDIVSVTLAGGAVTTNDHRVHECLNAAGGSLYVSSTAYNGPTEVMKNVLALSNNGHNNVGEVWAVTVLDQPALVDELSELMILNNAAVAVGSIQMCYSTVNERDGSNDLCSTAIRISESTILSRELLKETPRVDLNVFTLSSNVIDIIDKSVIYRPTMLNLDTERVKVDAESVITFGCMLAGSGHLSADFFGIVAQILSPDECKEMQLLINYTLPSGFYASSNNVTSLGQISSQLVAAKGHLVNILGPYVGVPESFNLSSCFSNISAQNMTCAAIYHGKVPSQKFEQTEFSNNQVLVVADAAINVQPNVLIEASLIEMCSVHIEILENATFDARGRGCPANEGVGHGSQPSDSMSKSGGGGAGFGGAGGDGSASTPGGVTYGLRRETFSVGSGGGVASAEEEVVGNDSAGGGFVLLAAIDAIDHYGKIRASGRGGSGNSGGGSGGMVYLYTDFLHGNGSISVVGGSGGLSGGGGGGGGHIEIDAGGETAKYDYSGTILAHGGIVTEDATTNPYPYPGEVGYITWPSCPEGSGNDYTTYAICYQCNVGFYSEGGAGECIVCSNKPSGSHYTNKGEMSSDCAYECDTGRQGGNCYTSFEYFVNFVGGIGMFVMYISISLFFLLAPLLILRMNKSSRNKTRDYARQKRKHGSVLLFSKDSVGSSMANFISRFPSPLGKDDESFTPAGGEDNSLPTALLMPEDSCDHSGLSYSVHVKEGTDPHQQTFHELRLNRRLGDKDLRYHVGRIYVDGVNSPFHWLGGGWELPLLPPPHLLGLFVNEGAGVQDNKEMYNEHMNKNNDRGLDKNTATHSKWTSYSRFVQEVNAAVRWEMNGWEVAYYFFLLLAAPPRAERFLLHRRLERATKFMQVVAAPEWNFFVSKSTSLRVNLSPDFTVATLDFIMFDTKNIPRSLRLIGQPRLPICLRFCGLGTYFSPWYIDTNDVLMQSISQANEVCIFIDKAWINFIIELNLKLRKLRRYSLTGDLTVFLQQLLEDKFVGSLGGVITQFCCFLKPDKVKTTSAEVTVPPAPPSAPSSLNSSPIERRRFKSSPDRDGGEIGCRADSPASEYVASLPAVSVAPLLSGAPPSSKNNNFAEQEAYDINIKNKNMLSEFASIRQNGMQNASVMGSRGGDKDRDRDRYKDYNPESNDLLCSHPREYYRRAQTSRDEAGVGVSMLSEMGEMKRPVGFSETCRLITNGEVYPGLIFFHETTPVEDVVDVDEDEEDDEENNRKSEFPDNPFFSLNTGYDTQKSAAKLDSNKEIDKYGDGAQSGRDVYGTKIDELGKFYRILADADEKNNSIQPQSEATSFSNYQHPSDTSSASLYRSESATYNNRNRTHSHLTNDSSDVSSHVSSESISDRGMKDFRKSYSQSSQGVGSRQQRKLSAIYQHAIQVWSWSCKSSKPMLLTAAVFSNCTSVSTLKLIYPTTTEVVGEALSNFFRCETILRKNKYTIWEHIVKFTSMINRILSHGTNKLPRSKLFQHSMTALFFLFVFLDIGCTCFLTLTYWCVWGNRTACDNHTGVSLMHSVWPGALIMTPLMGLRVIILNSTGTVARQYVCWSRLACFNCIVMVVIYLKWTENAKTFLNIPILVAYAGSRLFQNYYFDSLLATTENKRTSRGWNGLYTSLTNYEIHEFT